MISYIFVTPFRPKHPYCDVPTSSLPLAEPASLSARVTKREEERSCLGSDSSFSFCTVNAAFKHNDMSCLQLLIDHDPVDYSWLLDRAVNDDFGDAQRETAASGLRG